MEGILKAAQTVETQRDVKKPETPDTRVEGKPIEIDPEIYGFFDLNPTVAHDREKIETIVGWARGEDNSLAQTLKNIKDLELKLGTPKLDESRINRLYNYVRLTNSISSRQTQLNETLDQVRGEHSRRLKLIRENRDDKLKTLNNEISKINKDYRRAQQVYSTTASEKSSRIRQEYAQQIRELKMMRDAYKGGK